MNRIYLYSFGGVGTRMVHKWLDSTGVTTNSQPNVHHGNPPNILEKDEAIIYLFGSPTASVLSFYNKFINLDDKNFLRLHSQNLLVPPVTEDINAYVKEGRDAFGLINHYNRYVELLTIKSGRYKGPVIITDLNGIWNNEETFLKTLGIKAPFPERKDRREKDWVTEDIMNGLDTIYKDFTPDKEFVIL